MSPYLLLVLVAASFSLTSAAKLPKSWKVCKRNDPNLNECLKPAIQGAISDLMKGVPSLGILPLDPLHLIRLELDQGGSKGPVAVNLTFMDVDFFGFKSAVIKNIDSRWNDGWNKAQLMVTEPIRVIGDYVVNGKVLLLPITGQGKCNFTLTDVSSEFLLEGKYHEKEGKRYYHVDKFTMKLNHSRVYMSLENLFNGDKALGDNMNKFLNENSEEVYGSFSDTLNQGLGEAFRLIANRLFDRVPIDQIAPPN